MRDGSVMRTPHRSNDEVPEADQERRDPVALPATRRNGIQLFPVRPDAGPVTPALVKALLEGTD
jgi:hypothetical protein